ncbi:tbc1 domain family member 5 [Phtheirospermum japonicum]|uniref:Tbc1 domain family member 5 n=1 Tax=Phtheirospermum japonicum TaxID=374723 RepID=A0A830BKC7_9LAMI|nr:tbc1 domain family member 5 [Phtheirospermum japonicum]
MSTVPINDSKLETTSFSGDLRRFGDLRGVQWRIDLGILPSCPSASIDDLRRVTANSRRRYAALRRQLLVDPHVPKDGSSSPDLVMDNPLSQSPDSMWGRFFRNAELERMVDQDLTRLYPERDDYFQTSVCQGMLRRILLLWCLRHPEYGYRQGMHELLAPLLYVLHVDVERLSEVRKTYDDQFADKFDGFSFHENDLSYKFDFKKFSDSIEDVNGLENNPTKPNSPNELDPEIQTIVLLSDAYGAEGELGIVLSEKFMEHDAYSMFDSLMSGGAVAMSDFFSPFVIEASTALYHLLSIVDSSLHAHLVELGVEPQYFALRWLRVLFGREFPLEDLLVVWDEIFARENKRLNKFNNGDAESNFGVLESPRGAFICAFAVSMILNLRSSLLATENATACLKRLLNFPDDVGIEKILAKARSLHKLVLEANGLISGPVRSRPNEERRSTVTRGHSLSLDSTSPRTPLSVVANSYWEEKWRVLHEDKKEEEENNNKESEQVPNRRKGWSERVKLRLSRTESDPTPSKKNKIPRPSVRRSLLEDLARQLGADEDNNYEKIASGREENSPINGCDQDIDHQESTEVSERDDVTEANYENENESKFNNSPDFSDPTDSINGNSENENDESERSSVASNSLVDESDGPSLKSTQNDDLFEKLAAGVKEKRLLSAKFQWLWKFGRNNNASEGTSERKSGPPEDAKASCDGESDGCDRTCGTSKGETVDQNLMVSLKNLGQSMLENIQVIETVFQQDRGQTGSLENFSKNGLVGKGQVTAMAALKELRKISNLLSEM